MIYLYFWPTSNGKKVTILLEETGLPYRMIPLNIIRGEQFAPAFLEINPNHRMPAIVDDDPVDGGLPVSVFESGAILMYLAEKSGQLWPQDARSKYAAVQWVMWQMANFGAKVGEFNHFNRLDGREGDQSYALKRYSDETHRLYGVLNWGLYNQRYLAGDLYGIADICLFPWANNWPAHGVDLDEFVHVKRWWETVAARPAVQRGMDVGKDLIVDPATFSPEEQARFRVLLYNQRAIPLPPQSA